MVSELATNCVRHAQTDFELAVRSGEHVRVEVRDAATIGPRERLDPSDLVIDAAYGTGFRGEYDAPDPNGACRLRAERALINGSPSLEHY